MDVPRQRAVSVRHLPAVHRAPRPSNLLVFLIGLLTASTLHSHVIILFCLIWLLTASHLHSHVILGFGGAPLLGDRCGATKLRKHTFLLLVFHRLLDDFRFRLCAVFIWLCLRGG